MIGRASRYYVAGPLMTEPKDAARTRTFTWTDPRKLAEQIALRGGMDFLHAMKRGELPGPPFAVALGMIPEIIEDGRVVFSMDAEEWMCNPAAVVHGGMAATLLDTVLTLAIVTTLARGKSALTVDMNIHYVRPLLPTAERITAEGKVVHVGKTLGTAEGRVLNASGKLVAHGTATLSILDLTLPNTDGGTR
jgi:uncharacterized protein (TIGR00369 family)